MKSLYLSFVLCILSIFSFAAIAPITGTTSICLGHHKVLTDSTAGGVWSSNDTTVASVDTTGTVTGVATGTATITYTIDTASATILVTINALPNIYDVTGGGTRCANGPGVDIGISGSEADVLYDLFVVSPFAGSSESDGGDGSAFNFAPLLTAGTFVVIATSGTTGCFAEMNGSATITSIPAPPEITGPNKVCTGDTITLTDSVTGGAWSCSPTGKATISATGVVTGIASGAATITYTSPATGCFITRLVDIASISLPMVTYNAPDNTFYATAGYTGYQWYNSGEGVIPGATLVSVAALDSGYYYVLVTSTNGCERYSVPVYYNPAELGINLQTSNNGISIYPNPATNELIISFGKPGSNVSLLNQVGQIVYSYVNNAAQVPIDVSKLRPGMYTIVADGKTAGSFIKE